MATQADIDAPAEGHGERGRAGHAAGYSADDGKADSPTEIRKSLPEQSMTKDGGPTEARRGTVISVYVCGDTKVAAEVKRSLPFPPVETAAAAVAEVRIAAEDCGSRCGLFLRRDDC